MKIRWLPQTLYGRLVLMLFVAFIGVQLVIALLVVSQLPQRVREGLLANDLALRINPVISFIEKDANPPSEATLRLLSGLGFNFPDTPDASTSPTLEWMSLNELLSSSIDAKLLQLTMARVPETALRGTLSSVRGEARDVEVLMQLRDGRFLRSKSQIAVPPVDAIRAGLIVDAAIRLLGVIVIALALTRWLVSPLRRLAAQADALGRNLDSAPVSEEGPREVQRTARAFNEMQERLRNYVDERTRMLTAISHDLRTPITRVLLRLEMMPPSEARDRSISDLTQLTEMVNETLDFVRGEHGQNPPEPIDLFALLHESVRAANSDAIGFVGASEYALVLGRRASLLRLFGNVIENALRYAGSARVCCNVENGEAIVTVDDNGPGVPEAELERVLEPFYRVEKSRNAASGGSGLGLAIARDIARAHGGDIRLINRDEGGLRVLIALPQAHIA